MFQFLRQLKKPKDRGYTRLEHAEADRARVLVVNWCLGNTCNYSCTYCPDYLHNGKDSWVSLETIQNFVEQVQKHYGNDREYVFEFTGGEVTLHPQFVPMLQYLNERKIRPAIISNASRAMPTWEKIRPLLDQACLSFHPQFAKPDHFLKVARFLSEEIRVHLNFMMDPDHFYDCFELAHKAREIPNISIALQPLMVDFGNTLFNYTDTQIEIFKNQHALISKYIKHDKEWRIFRGAMNMVMADGSIVRRSPHQFISTKENSWKGWQCFSGLEQFAVNMDGRIHRGWCEEGGSFGRITDKKIRFPTDPITCTRGYCHCNFDIMSTKVKVRQ